MSWGENPYRGAAQKPDIPFYHQVSEHNNIYLFISVSKTKMVLPSDFIKIKTHFPTFISFFIFSIDLGY
jgi:hypothetical protein